jgi:hypothetical protein
MPSRLLPKDFSFAFEVFSRGHEVYHDLLEEVAARAGHMASAEIERSLKAHLECAKLLQFLFRGLARIEDDGSIRQKHRGSAFLMRIIWTNGSQQNVRRLR